MIIFIDDSSQDDVELMRIKTLEHLPRIGETVTISETAIGIVADVIHNYEEDDIYIYLDLIHKE